MPNLLDIFVGMNVTLPVRFSQTTLLKWPSYRTLLPHSPLFLHNSHHGYYKTHHIVYWWVCYCLHSSKVCFYKAAILVCSLHSQPLEEVPHKHLLGGYQTNCAQEFYLLSETDGKNCIERLEAMVEKAPMRTCNDYKGRLLICLYFTCYSLLSRSNVLLSKLDSLFKAAGHYCQ